jgi:hypothetical protein
MIAPPDLNFAMDPQYCEMQIGILIWFCEVVSIPVD